MDDTKLEQILKELSGRIGVLAEVQQKMSNDFEVFYRVHEKQELEFNEQKQKLRENCRAVMNLQKADSNFELKLATAEKERTVINKTVTKLTDEFMTYKKETAKELKTLDHASARILAVSAASGGAVAIIIAALYKFIFTASAVASALPVAGGV